MERHFKYSNLKRWRNILTLSTFLLLSIPSPSQDLTLLSGRSISKPTAVAGDQQGAIYLADVNGQVGKYDRTGKQQLIYEPTVLSEVTNLENQQALRTFVFYRDLQEYLFLDRFLTPSANYRLADLGIGFGKLATPSADNGVWVFDETNFRLVKINPTFEQIVIDAPLDLILDPVDHDITFMREYQNRLFMADSRQGLIIFDNLANEIGKIDAKGISYFTFLNHQVAWIRENRIELTDLYTSQKTAIALPSGSNYQYFLIREEDIVLFSDTTLDIFERTK